MSYKHIGWAFGLAVEHLPQEPSWWAACNDWAWKQPVRRPAQRMLLVFIAFFADAGGKACVSLDDFAKAVSETKRVTKRNLIELEARGLIRIQQPEGAYRLLVREGRV